MQMIKLRKRYILDAKDEQLIRLLSQNSRRSLLSMQCEMGITRQAIAMRLERLEEAGIIKQYTLIVDWDKVADGDEIAAEMETMEWHKLTMLERIRRGDGLPPLDTKGGTA
jgi:DNA-binding Lrp family transcriptional regulator